MVIQFCMIYFHYPLFDFNGNKNKQINDGTKSAKHLIEPIFIFGIIKYLELYLTFAEKRQE